MSEKDRGGPAFPVNLPGWGDNGASGMTLRDYFAAKAMQGLLSDSNLTGQFNEFAERAYSFADAMLEARKS